MILIADSGSTKTAWRLVRENGKIDQFTTAGLNPVHRDRETMRTMLSEELIRKEEFDPAAVSRLYFYGAGCVPGNAAEGMKEVLKQAFPRAEVEVADDMLAVARGVCGHDPGIACILGTGSNSCHFDGQKIDYKVPALGFILGDEGSGVWLGKKLLAAFIRGEMPDELSKRFQKQYGLDRSSILENVYSGAHPASFMAGFSKFLFRHRTEPWVYRLIHRGFLSFIEKNIVQYPDHDRLPVHFSGSVAFYYSTILRNAASGKGITVKNIVEGPIAGLTLYHQHQIK